MQQRKIKVIISGGGTGGHIFPAIAIANEIKRVNPVNEVLFVGAEGRMEMEKVPSAGYKIIGLKISGIQRKLTLSNLTLPFKAMNSVIKARSIINEFEPDVAVGVGGYASGPLLFAASMMTIPTLIQEQNSYAGITNKLLAKRARRICVAYDGMEKYFPKNKIVITGNPVRQDILKVHGKREEALEYFKVDGNRKILLVIGGSLGAGSVNTSLGAGLEKLAANNIQLIWQTGKRYFDQAQEAVKAFEQKNLKAYDFITRMDLAYACADVVISRAGASSISELELVAKPCILVPSPNVSEDHQTKNAMALVQKDAALIVKDSEARSMLVDTAINLLNDPAHQKTLSENISMLAHRDSAEAIVKEIYAILK